ncbi:DUF6701 domain-containing protein [Massilia sp. TN1-12]|uniref:DUF6701 domain-containing protein n=1 Tax=Massilia paldalensis TaxID=3377675 RepID=UPI00384F8E20
MPLRRPPSVPLFLLTRLLVFMLLCAGGTAARAGDTYTFAGNGVTGCSLSGKTYTCPALPLPNWDDKVVIANGYTVTANGDVNFGYDQGLSISGGGTLKISGNLNIGNIRTSLLQVNGATLIAGKTFSMGAQIQTIVADISAASMNLGTGSQTKITGKVTSTGAVNIASYTTIVGPVSGTTIVTNSPVTLTGDITATTSLSLASYSTVKGNIVAPTITSGSPITVEGNVTAKQSFQIASGSSVTGNVTTGERTLDASEAIINGSATVNHATLNWHGRVTGTIVCTGGTAPGKCDCVTNESGYDIRKNANSKAEGPYCEGKAQPAPALDHFVISHDQNASICAPSTVIITACANASCTSTYTGGATVSLQPLNQSITIDSSGTAKAAVTMQPLGNITLSLSSNGVRQSATCRVSGTTTASNCGVQVSDIGLSLSAGTGNAFIASRDNAATRSSLTVSALRHDGTTCRPLFTNASQDINLSFAYDNPASGTVAPIVAGKKLTAQPQAISLSFDDKGTATPSLAYADAGRFTLAASYAGQGSQAKGSVTAVAVPARFDVAVTLPAKKIAGSAITATVTARNADGDATPNFGAEAQAVTPWLDGQKCNPMSGEHGLKFAADNNAVVKPNPVNNALPVKPTTSKAGVQTFALRMDEAGGANLAASVDKYLDTLPIAGASGSAPSCAIATFVPAYFEIGVESVPRTTLQDGVKLPQYYSGERAIELKVTPKNLRDQPTLNYTKDAKDVVHDVNLTVLDAAGNVVPSTIGKLVGPEKTCASSATSASVVCAEQFGAEPLKPGVARWTGGYQFAAQKSAPLTATLRATEAVAVDPVSSSAHAPEPRVVIRTGRVRLSNVYGSANKPLSMPVNVEYWSGNAWQRSVEDSTPSFEQPAFALASEALKATTRTFTAVKNGVGTLLLQPPAGSGPGTVLVALNLGSDDKTFSCLANGSTAPGAQKDFLRAVDPSCDATKPKDPSARATFGIFAPERRRVIHMREVFR